jgi:diguanylate cyclase (GGDEF)-like protein/PAS domain S-box-containing protein
LVPPAPALSVLLAGDGGRWHLAGPVIDQDARKPTAQEALPGHEHWRIEVYAERPGLLAAAPGTLALGVALIALILGAALVTRHWDRTYAADEARGRERLRAYRRQLDALLESSTDGILLIAVSGVIELFSPAAEAMFGHRADDVVGQDVGMLLPELFDHDTVAALDEDSARPLRITRETAGLRANANRFPARIGLKRLMLDSGPRVLLVVQDLTETAEQAKKLRFLEQRDVTTGLLNRKEFERRMQRMLAEAAGGGRRYALCYMDIDQFKVVNDTAGHVAGDALIEQLATLIRVKLNSAALLARLGGDEFGALFADCDEKRALDLCNNLMESLRHFSFVWRHTRFDVAVSIGVTAFVPEHESAAAELARADVACHMAKREGRNRIHVYRDSDTSLIRHHGDMHLVSTITQALSSGRFRLYAQPIMPLAGSGQGRTHYEILVRMIDERGKPIEPELFIPAAEQYILMPAVDRWVIRQLFALQGEQLRAWHRKYPDEFLYAINLSGTSLNNEHFLPYLKREMEIRRIPPASICFELTETAALRSLGDARSMMQQLAELGCSFALDDFGSGLASYSYLRELPVKYLKIDGSFVRDMNSNPVNYAMVSSINQIAHVLEMKTIAEWAEDHSTINQLRALNVDYVQGYAIGTPLPMVAGDAIISAEDTSAQVGHG